MKKRLSFVITVICILIIGLTACVNTKATSQPINKNPDSTSNALYKDGTYEAKSSKTSEGYYGKAKINISQGLIDRVEFQIYDTSIFKMTEFNKNVPNYNSIAELPVDENYGPTVYSTMQTYKNQCVNELAGIEKYKKTLIDMQDVSEVDVISGATWSHEIFSETVANTLKNAKK